MEHDGPCDADLIPTKVDIVPFETEQLAHSQACPESQEDKSALANAENSNEPLNIGCAKYRGNSFPLCTLSYELNRVAIRKCHVEFRD